MGRATEPERVMLFAGVIGRPDEIPNGEAGLVKLFGPLAGKSTTWEFSHTDYYRDEFGAGLKRMFVTFQGMISPQERIEAKIATNRLENKLAKRGKRRVNLDPGYLHSSKVVLATTKDYSHRLYLGKGIFGEVTLRYSKGEYRSLAHTYPDYRGKAYREFFGAQRRRYLEILRKEK